MPIPLLALLGIVLIPPPVVDAIQYGSYKVAPIKIPPESELVNARKRGTINAETYRDFMKLHGYMEQNAEIIYKAELSNPAPQIILDAYHRKLIPEKQVDNSLLALGFDMADVQMMKAQSLFYPSPQDLITWLAREVYEPDSVKRYGLDDELDNIDKEPLHKAGLDDEQIRNYWRAHWQQPSWTQVTTFLHRRLMTPEQVEEWFRLVEIPPHWRKMFIKASYLPYTRVDIRRMWDLEVASDEDVVNTYMDEGYDRKHAENLLLFTKLERSVPEITKRYANGWLTESQVKEELAKFGATKEKAQRIFEKIVKAQKQERVTKEKDLTKAEIVKGVKNEIITPEQGQAFLERMGYDADEATFILLSNINWLTGSFDSISDAAEQIEAFRKSQGMDSKMPDNNMKIIAADIKKMRHDSEKLIGQEKAALLSQITTKEKQLKEIAKRLNVPWIV